MFVTPSRSPAPAASVRAALLLLVLLALAACGGDTSGPADASVTSVVVTGAPHTTMLVGDSARLVATAVNASGGIVSNQHVSWSSSTPAVAAVRSDGTVIAIGAGQAIIKASVGSHDGTATLDVADGITLGTQGGTLTAAGGAVTLTIPAGRLAQPTLLLVAPATNGTSDPRVIPNTAYTLGPDGVTLGSGGTLTIRFDPSKVPATLARESLQLFVQSGNAWAVVPGSKVDLAANSVSGTVARSGIYAVRSTPVDRIVLSGSAVGGALYVTQAARISTALYASWGDSLPSRAMTWNSSAQSVASVDASGNVTAAAPGSTTITASTDGQTAATTVTVLARAAEDWSRAADWTTFGGNAQHTGYVDATLDPVSFRERWVVTPQAGGAYWDPTTGGGRLYLAMSSPYSKLLAIDPANGSQLWLRNFGTSFGINQPTYDSGSVYVASGGHQDTYMWALAATDGSVRFQTPFQSQWEHWKAPVIAGPTVVAAGGYYGGMYGFDRGTGAQTFFMAGPQIDGWAPVAANGVVYVTGYAVGGGVRVVRPTDGNITAEIPDSRLSYVTTPVIGSANDLLTITGGHLVSVDLVAKTVRWDQSASYTGVPVVGGGVVYGISNGAVMARAESDGSLLWIWTPPAPYKAVQTLLLTRNVLFTGVSGANGAPPGATFAIDVASHLTVWSYPAYGAMALSDQAVLYVVHAPQISAITLR